MIVQSDAELVKVVCSGHREAYAQLVSRYEYSVRAVAVNILNDGHLADDVVQDVFIKAFVKLPKLLKPAAFNGWLMRIVTMVSCQCF